MVNFSGETLGDLASAVEYASDAAIGKLLKDTERYLERAVSSPFAALHEGLQLSSNGKEATVLKAQGFLGGCWEKTSSIANSNWCFC